MKKIIALVVIAIFVLKVVSDTQEIIRSQQISIECAEKNAELWRQQAVKPRSVSTNQISSVKQ